MSTEDSVAKKIEQACLSQHANTLSYRDYLNIGYTNYRLWMQMVLGLDDIMKEHLNFCLARHLNQVLGSDAMGVDLEMMYITHRLETLFGKENMVYYKDALRKTLNDNLKLPELQIEEFMKKYYDNPFNVRLTLTDAEFNERLKNVPTHLLAKHSSETWRHDRPDKANETPYPVTRRDIVMGEAIGPPTSRHMGIQLLGLQGYLDSMPSVSSAINPKQAKHHALTYF